MAKSCNGWDKMSGGKADLGNEEANKVKDVMNRDKKLWDAKKREWLNPKKVWESIHRNVFDIKGKVKREVRARFGEKAEVIIRELELSAGGSAVGDVQYQIAHQKIFAGLSEKQFNKLNEIIQARRVIAIDTHKKAVARNILDDKALGTVFDARNEGHMTALAKVLSASQILSITKYSAQKQFYTIRKKNIGSDYEFTGHDTEAQAQKHAENAPTEVLKEAGVLHPGGLTSKEHQAFLDAYKKLDPKNFKQLDKYATLYFKIFESQLGHMRRAGLISQKNFDNMRKVGDYSPRRYIQFFDPDITADEMAQITTGSTQALEQDSSLLMRDYIVRLHSRIAKNKANVELYKYAVENPKNGIATIIDDEAVVPDNFKVIKAYVDGKSKRMKMPLEYGKDWGEIDPALDHTTGKILRFLSGASIVRAMATGYNPEFALTNLPRDLFFSWFRTKEYSSAAPFAFVQMPMMLKKVSSDVWHTKDVPTGRALDFLKEGGMMEFMTTQGQTLEKMFKGGSQSMTKKSISTFSKWASFTGQKTELWVRLALREQAIKNRVSRSVWKKYNKWNDTGRKGASPVPESVSRHATWVARSYLDFSQGGKLSKVGDVAIPYLNAGLQATRGMFSTLTGRVAGGGEVGASRAKEIARAHLKMAQFIGIFGAFFIGNMMRFPDEMEKVDDRDLWSSIILFSDFTDKDKLGRPTRGYFKVTLDQGQAAVGSLVGLLFTNYLRTETDLPPDSVYGRLARIRPEVFREGLMNLIPFTNFLPPTIDAALAFANMDSYRWRNIHRGVLHKDKGQEYTPFTHPALTMSVQKLNELLPSFGGMIPDEPFSPERMKFVIETFFVPSNSIVRLATLGIDSLSDKYLRTPEEKEIRDRLVDEKRRIFKRIPGLDRVYEITHGESVHDRKKAHNDMLDGNSRIAKVKNQVKLFESDLHRVAPDDRESKRKIRKLAITTINSYEKTKYLSREEAAKMREQFEKSFRSAVKKPSKIPRFLGEVKQSRDAHTRAVMIFNNYQTQDEKGKRQLLEEFYADKELNIGKKGLSVASILQGMIAKDKHAKKSYKLEGTNKTITEMTKKGWDYFDWRE